MPIDLPILTGTIPHDAEQAILRLREAIEALQAQVSAGTGLAGQSSLDQIQQALGPQGSNPLPTAGLLNTLPPSTNPVPTPEPGPGQQTLDGYADTCPDGTRVTCTSPQSNLTPSVTFGSDAPIILPSSGQYLWAESGGFGHLAIVQGEDGKAYLIDRATMLITDLGPTYGNYAVAIRPDGTPVWQDSPTTYSVGGSPATIPPAFQGTTNGFLSLDGAGDPIWTDDQIANPVVIDDVTFLLAAVDAEWTVGKSALTESFIAYNSVTATMYTVGSTSNSPVAARVTKLSDGSAVLSRSLPTGFFPSSGFFPYATPGPVPGDAIDLSTVIIAKGADPRGWTETSTLGTVTHIGDQLCTPHSMAGIWPGVPFYGDETSLVEGNQWLFAFIGGQWYAGAAEFLRSPAQICKTYAGFIGEDFGGTPMEGWSPAPGEAVGIMVSCPARGGQWSLAERSNVVIINW